MAGLFYFNYSLLLDIKHKIELKWINEKCSLGTLQSISNLVDLHLEYDEFEYWPSFIYNYDKEKNIVYFSNNTDRDTLRRGISNPLFLAKLLYSFLELFRCSDTVYSFEWVVLDLNRDSFTREIGGGAFVITKKGIKSLSTLEWINKQTIKIGKK